MNKFSLLYNIWFHNFFLSLLSLIRKNIWSPPGIEPSTLSKWPWVRFPVVTKYFKKLVKEREYI